jgi:hypothetical protein
MGSTSRRTLFGTSERYGDRYSDRYAQRPGQHPLVSKRFLQPDQLASAQPARAWSGSEVFAEGQWQSVRVQLEARGWNALQIEQIHDQLRQGWPLALAESNVAATSGHCPIKARHG